MALFVLNLRGRAKGHYDSGECKDHGFKPETVSHWTFIASLADQLTDSSECPTDPFTIMEHNNQKIDIVQERRTADFEVSKLWKGMSGGCKRGLRLRHLLKRDGRTSRQTNSQTSNLSISPFVLHKICRTTDCKALKLCNFRSGFMHSFNAANKPKSRVSYPTGHFAILYFFRWSKNFVFFSIVDRRIFKPNIEKCSVGQQGSNGKQL